MAVATGRQVSIEYTLRLSDKTRVDSNVGEPPLTYTQGSGALPPALQAQLVGLTVGDTKTVTLTPEQGYGEVDPNAYHEVEKSLIPEGARKPGSMLTATDPAGGEERVLRVHEVKDETVVLDFNHPLAGKTLVFDVKVVKIESAPE